MIGRSLLLSASLTLAFAPSFVAPSWGQKPEAPVRSERNASNPSQDEDFVDRLLSRMTVEEKAAQLVTQFVVPIPGMAADPVEEAKRGVGSFLFVADPVQANKLQRVAMEQSRLKIPVLFGFDVIHGFRTIFPVPVGQAASWDPAMVEQNQDIAGREARAAGIHWVFAPNVDIARDARWGRMVEGAGEDPYLGSIMAAAQVRGFQGSEIGAPGHVIAGPKHFAGYGASLGGRDYDEVNLSDADLWNVYLPPFKAAVDAGAGNIMSAYMGLNGIPAAGNNWLLTEVLRRSWGFKGWVVGDSEAVNNLVAQGMAADSAKAASIALGAGLDMEMTRPGAAFRSLPQALAAGEVTMPQIDAAVRRVLEAKMRLGLFRQPYADEDGAAKVLDDPAHLVAAERAAERSAVLLRNAGRLLPLNRNGLRSIAVIGSLADSRRDALGSWAFPQNRPPMQSILEGLRAKLGASVSISYAPGVALPKRLYPSPFAPMDMGFRRPEPTNDDEGIREAVAAAKVADVAVMVVDESQDMSGESASRSSLDLPGRQQELLDAVVATGKPVVVLLMNGRPLDLKDTKAAAILELWYPGSRGGSATANLLFGDAVPGGKLPFTWPRNAAQLPAFYAHLESHKPKDAFKRYWNESNAPVYPFGYGLSYTTFSYSKPRVSRSEITAGQTLIVSVEVRNSGSVKGDEVAQLYLHQRSGTAARPVRELKGFQRISLQPNESRTLNFTVGPAELRYWNAGKRDWVIDSSVIDVAVGTDSDVAFAAQFKVVSSSGAQVGPRMAPASTSRGGSR